jgi:hypothetical protein
MHLSPFCLVFACIVSFNKLPAAAQGTASIASNTPPVLATLTSKPDLAVSSADSSVVLATSAAQVLKTRCLDTGLLRLGAACVFKVIEPMKVGHQSFAVGDLIYAHVETVQGVAGRVYMRTDRIISAKTQQATSLSMVATEQLHQPGVGIPHMLDGWKLNWEQL